MIDGGNICIKTRNRTMEDARFVSVSVTDTGVGMSQETLEHAFEPFYTTKDVGKGSGLGLSMVYGFCQQSNGKVFIDSKLGKGTTVEMLFPYTAGETVKVTREEEDFTYDLNKASILVVDDEPGVRELAASALADMGYNVISAEDGQGALDIINNAEIPIDLLFTDVVMPNGIDGFQLARAAHGIRPELPIVFTTGHAEVALKELKKDLSQKIKVLGKPYRINDLSHMIATVLSNKNG
jgi:CheY-like chemotaxis protein